MAQAKLKVAGSDITEPDIEKARTITEPFLKGEKKLREEEFAAREASELAKLDVEKEKLAAQGELMKAKAEFGKGAAEREQALYTKAEQDLASTPLPDFKPSEPDLRNYAQLGSLVMTMGIALGGAKGNALASISALSGALEGWNKGRKDVWEREIKKFQLEFNKIKTARDQIVKNLELGIKKLSAGNKAGLADIEAAKFISGSNSVIAKQIEAGRLDAAYQTAAGITKMQTEANRLILDQAGKMAQVRQARELAARQMAHAERIAGLKAASKEKGILKPGAEVTKNYLGQNALLADMQDIAKSLKDPNIRKMIDDNRLESFASEEMGKIVSQIANDQLPSDLRKFLVKVRNVRNNYYLTISGKAVTGGEAMRNYGVVSQPGDSAASMSDKTDSMINNVNRTIDQYQKLYGLPSLDAGMIDSLRTPTETSTFDVRSVPVDESQSAGIANAATASFGSYDPNTYTYGYENGRLWREKK